MKFKFLKNDVILCKGLHSYKIKKDARIDFMLPYNDVIDFEQDLEAFCEDSTKVWFCNIHNCDIIVRKISNLYNLEIYFTTINNTIIKCMNLKLSAAKKGINDE